MTFSRPCVTRINGGKINQSMCSYQKLSHTCDGVLYCAEYDRHLRLNVSDLVLKKKYA